MPLSQALAAIPPEALIESSGEQASVVGLTTTVGGVFGVLFAAMSRIGHPRYGEAYALGAALGTIGGLLLVVVLD